MKLRPSLFILFFALGVVGGCKNATIIETNALGTFRGSIALFNAEGDSLSQYDGAIVKIEGTQYQATSNATGAWQIDHVPAGIYNIVMTKPGFDTLIIPQYQFSGAGTSFVPNTGIQAIPMDSLAFTVIETGRHHDSAYYGTLTINGHVSGPDHLASVASYGPYSGSLDISGKFPPADTASTYRENITLQADGRMLPLGIDYNQPPWKSGTVLTFRATLQANLPKKYQFLVGPFQRATSPYVVVRTFVIP